MTVEELIEKLKTYDKNLKVVVYNIYDEFDPVGLVAERVLSNDDINYWCADPNYFEEGETVVVIY